MKVETVKVKADNERGYRVINRSDFDPSKHKLLKGETAPRPPTEHERLAQEDEARRRIQANYGQSDGGLPAGIASEARIDRKPA